MGTKARPALVHHCVGAIWTEWSRCRIRNLARDTEGQGYNSMYESHLNRWMQFQWLGAEDAELDLFRAKITKQAQFGRPMPRKPRGLQKVPQRFPNENEEFGLYQRGAERFVRISPTNFSELTADLPVYTGGAASGGFFFERLEVRTEDFVCRQCHWKWKAKHQFDGGDG